MSIDFQNTFGSRSDQTVQRRPFGQMADQSTERQQRPKAKFWLNVGYPMTYMKDGEEVTTFVSIATGIPLDQIEHFDPKKAGSENMAMMRQRQNLLFDGFMERAKELAPGESAVVIFDEQVGLGVEIKHVKGDIEVAPLQEPVPFSFRR